MENKIIGEEESKIHARELTQKTNKLTPRQDCISGRVGSILTETGKEGQNRNK